MLAAVLVVALACPLTITVTRNSDVYAGHEFAMADTYVTNPTNAPYVISEFHVGGQSRDPVLEDGISAKDLTVPPHAKLYFGFDIAAEWWHPEIAPSVECHAIQK